MPQSDPFRTTLRQAASILVAAPSAAAGVAFDRLVRPRAAGGNLFAVLYDRPGTAFVEELASNGGDCPDDVRVLDVGGTLRAADATVADDPAPTGIVGALDQLDDVDSVERELERTLEGWARGDEPSVVYVDSLTPLLRAVDAPLVGDFLDRMTSTLARLGARGVVRFEPSRHDERILRGLRHRVDATVGFAVDGESVTWSVHDPGAAAWLSESIGPERPPVDVALDLLRSPERRRVLAHLSIAGTAALDDLAAYLAGQPAVAGTDPESLEVALYQVHLPKLVDAGAVERDGRRVELRPPGDGVLPLLEAVNAYERR